MGSTQDAAIAEKQEAHAIQASASLAELQPRTLKQGDTFIVCDHGGGIVAAPGSPCGLFYKDTRHLSEFELRIDGDRPLLLGSAMRDDNIALITEQTNPDQPVEWDEPRERGRIHIRGTSLLWCGALHYRVAVRNFDTRAHDLRLAFRFDADFADLFEVRGERRTRRGTMTIETPARDAVHFRYRGLDRQIRETRLSFEPQPDDIELNTATYRITLRPYERIFLYVQADCQEQTAGAPLAFPAALRAATRALRLQTGRAASVETSNAMLNQTLCRSVADLYMLTTETPEGPYPYAGIPWFSTVFGRDGIITALQTLWLDPALAAGVLRFLAANQATARDPAADAEPGKILHEMRESEMALLGEVPFRRYYGSVDSTPLFVMLAGAYFARTGDIATVRAIWPAIEAALRWIEIDGDRDGDGFVEYARTTDQGLVNQGWKDSHDSIFHADGVLARGPIALCEVQGYVYAAQCAAADMARALDRPDRAAELSARAERLRSAFDQAFWLDDLQTYALALDGEKRPCRVRASNAGHALLAGIALPERAPALAATLMTPQSFSGWGVRTIASGQPRYNPMSYHDGSVWPHDNAMIALGLARYDQADAVSRIFDGLLEAANYMDFARLPELFCGFPRRQQKGPTEYPVACSPQAWAAAAPLALVQATTGLHFDAKADEIRFVRPKLPNTLNMLRFRRLSLGDSRADVVLWRSGREVAVEVEQRLGSAKVVTIA
jgi:glycogen debranching enzyme